MEESTPTAKLLEMIRTGDRDAELQLFQTHYPRLLRFAYRAIARAGVAGHCGATPDDIVQEAFERALNRGVFVRAEHMPRRWLAGRLTLIVRSAAIDLARRRSSSKGGGGRVMTPYEEFSSTSGAAVPCSIDQPTPTSAARVAELRALVKSWLTQREWEVWKLIVLDGLDSNEVAERFGDTPGAIRSLLRRARQRIIRRLPAPTL